MNKNAHKTSAPYSLSKKLPEMAADANRSGIDPANCDRRCACAGGGWSRMGQHSANNAAHSLQEAIQRHGGAARDRNGQRTPPGNAARPLELPRTSVGADHRKQYGAEAEDERNHDVFEPRTYGIA